MIKELNETLEIIKALEKKYTENDLLSFGNIFRALNIRELKYFMDPDGHIFKDRHYQNIKIEKNKSFVDQNLITIQYINNELKNVKLTAG